MVPACRSVKPSPRVTEISASDGRAATQMPSFKAEIDEGSIKALATYVETFREIGIGGIVLGLLLLAASPWLKKLAHGAK